MQKFEPVECGKYYHIYNCGINGTNLFLNDDNYRYFLTLYERYIDPIADTFAWCLMRNHFHLFVRIHENPQVEIIRKDGTKLVKPAIPYRQFSHLFNAYSQAFNKVNNRHGGLFETPFERKRVNDERYFKQLIFYIHNNPVKHGFVKHMIEYPWSSYLSIISITKSDSTIEKVLGWFDSESNFIEFHKQQHDPSIIKEFIFD